ncbi:hypothetical protein F2P81_002979 [Scophthalmus maximus]|uniref:Uncharacterized protein n=1 Tax=Scophthalmus maximus TaxID=52904 RepID=A0A6A4TLR5_SCOMX|nr:hypothetical protein F2P81_002979 [Scophthalmus maximus]
MGADLGRRRKRLADASPESDLYSSATSLAHQDTLNNAERVVSQRSAASGSDTFLRGSFFGYWTVRRRPTGNQGLTSGAPLFDSVADEYLMSSVQLQRDRPLLPLQQRWETEGLCRRARSMGALTVQLLLEQMLRKHDDSVTLVEAEERKGNASAPPPSAAARRPRVALRSRKRRSTKPERDRGARRALTLSRRFCRVQRSCRPVYRSDSAAAAAAAAAALDESRKVYASCFWSELTPRPPGPFGGRRLRGPAPDVDRGASVTPDERRCDRGEKRRVTHLSAAEVLVDRRHVGA